MYDLQSGTVPTVRAVAAWCWGNLGQLVSPLCLRVDAHTGKIDASTRWKMSFTTAANEATASPVVVLLIDQSNHRICSQSLPLF